MENKIINNLSTIRIARGMKQSDLARKVGVTQATLSNWERGVYDIDNDSVNMLCEILEVTADYLLGITEDISKAKKYKKIPVLGKIPCGYPQNIEEYIYDYEEVSEELENLGELFGLIAAGDSMQPIISPNDVLIVVHKSEASTGDIIVVRLNGDEVMVKKLHNIDDGIELIPYNNAYGKMHFTNEEIFSLPVSIVGVVVEVRKKFYKR